MGQKPMGKQRMPNVNNFIVYTPKSDVAVTLRCSSSYPCKNVQLQDINIKKEKRGPPVTAMCVNIKALYFPPPCTQQFSKKMSIK
ncbi:oil palm polygalacturonase allergen PEST459 [Cinnamomum micranthum f. kanehirae]|uniref:Oil palm polygalacturonase allergen PEST459 n=1 Tax=Cinnamomum micranthum f. kanehirae TaxID=337451 RepID=A0A3S4PJF6_9MAGN|nr:oil palm polygalacturonase allergen PEST459 [Cinnamomum micranthum f. kanehirae]